MRARRAARSDGSGPGRALPIAAMVAAVGCIVLAAPATAAGQAILNVERLQPGDVMGWHWGVEGAVSVSRGNSRYTDVLTGLALGHRWPADWLRVFAGLDYRSETGEDLEHDRYLHVRYNRWLAEGWQTFHFVQIQTSRQKLLQRRVLLGSGLRHRVMDGRTTLDVGTGAMYEAEDLDADRELGTHPATARVWRMANLLVATHRLTESVRVIGVSYLQPDLSGFADIRTLADISFLIRLTESVELAIRSEWRHDSRPPDGVDPDDLVLRTGLTFASR